MGSAGLRLSRACRFHKEFKFYSHVLGSHWNETSHNYLTTVPAITHKKYWLLDTRERLSSAIMGQKLYKWTDFYWPYGQLFDHPLRIKAIPTECFGVFPLPLGSQGIK